MIYFIRKAYRIRTITSSRTLLIALAITCIVTACAFGSRSSNPDPPTTLDLEKKKEISIAKTLSSQTAVSLEYSVPSVTISYGIPFAMSVDDEVRVYKRKRPSARALLSVAARFLREQNKITKNIIVDSLEREFDIAKLRAMNMRSVVIKNEKWWEYLEIKIRVSEVVKNPEEACFEELIVSSISQQEKSSLLIRQFRGDTLSENDELLLDAVWKDMDRKNLEKHGLYEQSHTEWRVSLDVDGWYATTGSMPASFGKGYKDMQTSDYNQDLIDFAALLKEQLRTNME